MSNLNDALAAMTYAECVRITRETAKQPIPVAVRMARDAYDAIRREPPPRDSVLSAPLFGSVPVSVAATLPNGAVEVDLSDGTTVSLPLIVCSS